MTQQVNGHGVAPPGFVPIALPRLECSVCSKVMSDTANLQPCNHKLCMTCAGRLQACPQCRVDLQGFAKDHAFSDLVETLQDAVIWECGTCRKRVFDRAKANDHVCNGSELPPPPVRAAELRNFERYPCKPALAAQVTTFGMSYQRAALDLCKLNLADGWWALGRTLQNGERLEINQEMLTDQHCYTKALDLDRTHSLPWNNLGTTLIEVNATVKVHGIERNRQQCFVEAVRHDRTNALAWCNLASTVPAKGWLLMPNGDNRVSRENCLKQALTHNARYCVAWQNLGCLLIDEEFALVNGRRWLRRECFEEAVRADPQNADSWYLLGMCLTKKERTLAGGDPQDGKRECLVRAIVLDPNMREAWSALADTLSDGCLFPETVTINGASFTQRDCEVRGL